MADDAPVQLSRKIPLDAIVVPERLRPVDEAWVEALAASMSEGGQIEPIVVRALAPLQPDRYALVAGAHRLAAARRLGWPAIEAGVRVLGELEARLVEIDENLMRRELSALDRAVFLAERKRVWEGMYPETAHGKAKKNKAKGKDAKMAPFLSFAAEVEKRTGLSKRAVARAVALVKELSADEVHRLRQTYLASHQSDLEAYSKLAPVERAKRLDTILAGGARTTRETAARAPRDRLQDAWERASEEARRNLLVSIGISASEIEKAVSRSKVTARMHRAQRAA